MVILGFVLSLPPSSIREYSPFPPWTQGPKVLDTDSEGQVLCGLLSPIQAFCGSTKPTTDRGGTPWIVAGEEAEGEVGCPRTGAEQQQWAGPRSISVI